jgi:hypothetical protein
MKKTPRGLAGVFEFVVYDSVAKRTYSAIAARQASTSIP